MLDVGIAGPTRCCGAWVGNVLAGVVVPVLSRITLTEFRIGEPPPCEVPLETAERGCVTE